jgi:hypothetical protein
LRSRSYGHSHIPVLASLTGFDDLSSGGVGIGIGIGVGVGVGLGAGLSSGGVGSGSGIGVGIGLGAGLLGGVGVGVGFGVDLLGGVGSGVGFEADLLGGVGVGVGFADDLLGGIGFADDLVGGVGVGMDAEGMETDVVTGWGLGILLLRVMEFELVLGMELGMRSLNELNELTGFLVDVSGYLLREYGFSDTDISLFCRGFTI